MLSLPEDPGNCRRSTSQHGIMLATSSTRHHVASHLSLRHIPSLQEEGATCPCVQGDLQLTNFQDGCLPAAFMVGLIAASPVFAALSKTQQPFHLVGFGLSVWAAAVAAGGASWSFWSLLLCRMAVGVGEASFVVLAAPFIRAHPLSCPPVAWPAGLCAAWRSVWERRPLLFSPRPSFVRALPPQLFGKPLLNNALRFDLVQLQK